LSTNVVLILDSCKWFEIGDGRC